MKSIVKFFRSFFNIVEAILVHDEKLSLQTCGLLSSQEMVNLIQLLLSIVSFDILSKENWKISMNLSWQGFLRTFSALFFEILRKCRWWLIKFQIRLLIFNWKKFSFQSEWGAADLKLWQAVMDKLGRKVSSQKIFPAMSNICLLENSTRSHFHLRKLDPFQACKSH